jgi:hypothetical protein
MFGTEHAKEEKKEIWKNFGISVSMWKFKICFRISWKCKVNELNLMQLVKKRIKCLKNWCICFALALRLGLDEFYFDNYAKDGNSILRPIHYPPITSEPEMLFVLLLMVISTWLHYWWVPKGLFKKTTFGLMRLLNQMN